jgi:hypothetical protein
MSIFKRAVRIVVVTAVALGLGVLAFGWYVRQPNRGAIEAPDLPKAKPQLLRQHVELLTTTAAPRNWGHPENLDAAASYVTERLLASGARVTDQEFEVRGTPFRNVVARLGPHDQPVLVVGAHYDVCGDLPGADDTADTLDYRRMAEVVDGTLNFVIHELRVD